MRILFIGDIVGKVGRRIVKDKIPEYVKKYDIDFVIANGENATHGKGLNRQHYEELINSGVDVVTLGNHYNSRSDISRYIEKVEFCLRPANLVNEFPGEGSAIYDVDGISVRVVNILGSAFMNEPVNNPYYCMLDILSEEETTITIVDFHGEATAEKMCFALAFDGKVSAVLGTHTHVQTRDTRILPKGTAFISDVGMCGAYDSVLGFEKESVLKKTTFGESKKFELVDEGQAIFSAVVIDIDNQSGLANEIFPIYFVEEVK